MIVIAGVKLPMLVQKIKVLLVDRRGNAQSRIITEGVRGKKS
jgi:hypothetical protein